MGTLAGKLKRGLCLVLAAAALALALGGCGSAAAKRTEAQKETVSFTDSAGRTVDIPADIESIAPSGALAQMILYTLCPDKLIGLCSSFSKTQKEYIDEAYWDLPVFGQFYGSSGTVNYESIIAANPDVIIDIGEKKETIVSDMDTLQEKTGIPVIFVEAYPLEDMPEAYETLGRILGCADRAQTLSDYIQGVLDLAAANREKLPETYTAAYVQGEYGLEVNACGSTHAAVLDEVGLVNVASQDAVTAAGGYEVSMEQMLLWDPQILLISPDGNFDDIYDDPSWQEVTAVKEHRVYEVPIGPYNWLDKPPSVQQILGILWLGNLVYPQIYDFDMTAKAQEFYSLFWHCDLTADKAKALMANSTFLED